MITTLVAKAVFVARNRALFVAVVLSFAFVPLVPAQTNAPASAPKNDQQVLLSPFLVSSTKDKGYTSGNAATGFKTNETLLKIPQAVTLVTRDLIDDIGHSDSSDVLQFAGVTPYFKGEAFAIRGARITFTLVDDVPDQLPYADNAYVDSYTVIRGPASTLYLNAALSGTVLVTTKKPLPNAQHSLTFKTDTNGLRRGELDTTGPLGSIGAAKFSYRLVGVLQGGETFLKNQRDDRISVHPMLQMLYKNTVVRMALDYHDIDHAANANNFITPEGKLYTGAGRDEGYFVRGAMENHEMTRGRLEILQKVSDNWDVKVAAQRWSYWRLGSNVFPSGGVNWPAQTMRFTARANDRGDTFSTVLADVVGKYTHWGRPMQTAFGTAYSEQTGSGWIRSSAAFGTKTVSISNPQLNLIQAPRIGNRRGEGDQGDYPLLVPGNGSTTYRGNAYLQQTVEVIPNRLTLIGGYTYSKIKTNSVSNLYTRPPATVLKGAEDLHRYGAVFNITKDLVVYGMESTTFTPQLNKDINGNTLPNQIGTGREAGIKTSFLDGRISSTIAAFELKLTNTAFFAGTLPNGTSYFAPIGTTTQKGFDADVAVTVAPGLQFVATYYDGTVKDQAGNRVPNTFTKSMSFFGRYEFQRGPFHGLSLGGGVARTSGRIVSAAGIVTGITPAPTMLEFEPGNLVNVFASYRLKPHWLLRANVENVLDKAFAIGAQTAYFVDPSPPRTLGLSATFTF